MERSEIRLVKYLQQSYKRITMGRKEKQYSLVEETKKGTKEKEIKKEEKDNITFNLNN